MRSRSPMQQNYFNERYGSPKQRYRSRSPGHSHQAPGPSQGYVPVASSRNSFSPHSRGFSAERTERSRDNWWNHNPKTLMDGIVKEYIDDFTGLMEVEIDGKSLTAFFHASVVWLVNPRGNPYGPPVKFTDVLGQNTATTRENKNVSLVNEMPIGSEIFMQILPVQNEFVQFVALFAWPKSTESPIFPQTEGEQKILEKKQEYFLKEFMNKVETRPKTDATFPGCLQEFYPGVEAIVYDIKDEQFGSIEIKGIRPKPFRFFALFHKDDVWLRDGKKATSVDFFRNKPLSEMCRVGQPVNVMARSILVNKGSDLAPGVLELQAVVVSLRVDKFPLEAPKPTW